MRILFLAHRLPFPPDKGDKIRSFHLLAYLAARHEVHVACPIDNAADLEHVESLRCQVHGLEFVRMDGLFSKLQRGLALLTGQPVSLRAFYSRRLQSQVDSLLSRLRFDCVFVYSSPMAQYVFRSRHWPDARRGMRMLADFIDVDSAKWSNYAASCPGVLQWPRRWLFRREARLLAAHECRVGREFDKVFLVTDAERNELPAGVQQEKVLALANGVDLEYFSHVPAPPARPARVAFTGVMDYWPNVEGVLWFVNEVWPMVRAANPDAHFDIVGRNPSPAVRKLEANPGVCVTGFVPDVREHVSAAQVCVAPLRIARGVQNKVLEAMAMGRPVVCTPQALEGISADVGKEALVADDPLSFSRAINQLLSDPGKAAEIGTAGLAYVTRNHRWSDTLAALDELLA
jgi:sugar transferase (PEP-CTERM/EpsH1 system associated)